MIAGLATAAVVALALAAPAAPPATAAGADAAEPGAPPAGAPAADLSAAGLAEFLEWTHPPGAACGPVDRIEVVTRWAGGLRVRFEIPCGAAGRLRLGAILETRQGNGVWQVAAGFETDEETMRDAIGARRLRVPRESLPSEVLPPPDNPGDRDSPLRSVRPPEARLQAPPVFPEEAGRARLIGDARVRMLVDVNPAGVPTRTRILRGPDPDLGMRDAAVAAVARWRFEPARFEGRPVRYFAPVEIGFSGLPPESRLWSHRALFDLQVLVQDDPARAERAAVLLRAGTPIEQVAPESALDSEWGLTAAAGLPAPVRAALHATPIGLWAGPTAGEGRYWLARKRGEVYYAILPQEEPGDLQYRVVHQRGIPDGDDLRRALDADTLDFTAERRRRDYMNEAARLMGLRQVRAEVGRMVVRTDVLGDEEVALLGSIVTEAFRAHQEFWAGLATLRLFRREVMVYAFARRSDHQKAQSAWLGRRDGPPAPSGEYIPASRILAFTCEATSGHLPIPVVIHEAMHMLDYERVYPPRVRPSKWFEEGLANYFGLSQVDSQLRIDPGAIRRSGTIVAGNVKVQFDPRQELFEHRRLSRERGAVPLAELIEAGADDRIWTGEGSGRSYGAAWTLVHFLLHGDRGRRAEAFRRYAAQEARGEGGPGTFRRIFGDDLAALETAWHDYEEAL